MKFDAYEVASFLGLHFNWSGSETGPDRLV